jgi:hypothetical protein
MAVAMTVRMLDGFEDGRWATAVVPSPLGRR